MQEECKLSWPWTNFIDFDSACSQILTFLKKVRLLNRYVLNIHKNIIKIHHNLAISLEQEV